MARSFLTPIDLNNLELLNFRLQNLAAAPSHAVGRAYYDTVLGYARVSTGSAWIDLVQGGTDAEAVRDVINSAIAAGTQTNITVTGSDAGDSISFSVAADGAAGTPTLRTLGTSGTSAAAGNDSRLSDTRTPTAGSVVDASVASNAAINADKLVEGTTNKLLTATERTNIAGAQTDRHTHANKATLDAVTAAYTTAEQTKLSGIATGATNYTDTNARANRLDQFAAPTASVSMGSQKITNLLDPTSAQDAATKAYVDATTTGLDVKNSVRAATTVAGTLASSFENGDVIDGVTLATGNRILIKNQASGAENGIYTVNATGAPTRATDADSNTEVTGGMFVFVEEGTANADTGWVMTNNGAITLGTTALTFAQFSGAGAYTAGTGLTQSGTTFNVGAGTGILANADDVAIDTTVVARKYTTTVGDGTATSYVITHNLNTRAVVVSVWLNSGAFTEVEVDVEKTSVNTITLRFATAPAASAYAVAVIG